MTAKEITTHTPPFFPTSEDWNAFNELADARDKISEEWLSIPTIKIHEHLIKNPQKGWSSIPWGCKTIDTKLYLTDFGPDSLFLCFAWTYELHLLLWNHDDFDSDEMNRLLNTTEYAPILGAFDRIDLSFEKNTKAVHYRNFSFGSPNDGNIPVNELAWYAGNETDKFVEQAISQLERFTKDEQITYLLGELNRRSRKQKAQ